MKKSTRFLKKVYEAADNVDECIDLIFDHINTLLITDQVEHETYDNETDLFHTKHYYTPNDKACDEIDEILDAVEIHRLPTAALLAFLTITAAPKQFLAKREAFYYKLYDVLPTGLFKGLE